MDWTTLRWFYYPLRAAVWALAIVGVFYLADDYGPTWLTIAAAAVALVGPIFASLMMEDRDAHITRRAIDNWRKDP